MRRTSTIEAARTRLGDAKSKGATTLDLSNMGLTSDQLSIIFHNHDLKGITALNLSGNSLETLVDSVVNKFGKLEKLNLANNAIRELPDGFISLDALKELDLSHNNLSSASALHGMSLEKLDMSHNNLGELRGFSSLRSLKELDLSYNGARFVSESFGKIVILPII